MNIGFVGIIIPLIFLFSFLYAGKKKVKIYDSFTNGVKNAPPLVLSIFPYIAAVTMLTELLEVSGLRASMEIWLSPAFDVMGIPEEIAPLALMKPLSGSGSIAVLSDILSRYGVDSYLSRCACVAYGASDTVFYISAVYFAGIKRKGLPLSIFFSLLAYFCALIFGCWLCRFL